MSEFSRQVDAERDRLQREEADALAWKSSAFNEYNPPVGHPSGPFAMLVSEVLPAIPASLWRAGFVGQAPDGVTRVTGWPYLGGTDERPADSALRLWWWKLRTGVAKCRVFATGSGTNGLVVLSDGRGAYSGDLWN